MFTIKFIIAVPLKQVVLSIYSTSLKPLIMWLLIRIIIIDNKLGQTGKNFINDYIVHASAILHALYLYFCLFDN